MPWPDIFFKSRTPQSRPEPAVLPAAKAAQAAPKPSASESPKPKSISQAMAEADTLRTLSRQEGIRVIKRTIPSDPPETTDLTAKAVSPPSAAYSPKSTLKESKKIEAPPKEPVPAAASSPDAAAKSVPLDKPASPLPIKPARRKARLIDFARLILPPKRVETPPTIIPASFPVSVATGNVLQGESSEPVKKATSPAVDISLSKKPVDVSAEKIIELIKSEDKTASAGESTAAPVIEAAPISTEPEKKAEATPAEKSTSAEFKIEPPLPATAENEPAKIESSSQTLSTSAAPQEKREFHLANGERILGRVLSETPEAVYLDHPTLGVLTLPRNQIAKRLVEIILINGDRIVGDIVAETPECLFVRHASLGMLTVPQTQRSTRVVEAILKDGDRILGEVLAETDAFTVIRSASLGTITVKHEQVAMLNRKLEQVELKALPPALENKPLA